MIKKFFIFLFLFTLTLTLSCANAAEKLAKPNEIRVGVLITSDSFVLDHIAENLWDVVSQKIGHNYVSVPFKSKKQAYLALASHKIDVLIGPIKIDRKQKNVSFLDSYLFDNIVIAIHNAAGLSTSIWPYLRVVFGVGVGCLLVVLFVFGSLVWIAEHRKKTGVFAHHFWRGIPEAMWFILVTMTTNGYGDFVPKSVLGRLVTSIFMFLSLFSLSAFLVYVTASLSSVKVASHQMTRLDQLNDKILGYVAGDQSAQFLAKKFSARAIQIKTMPTAIDYLDDKKVDALFVSSVRVRAFLHDHPLKKVTLTDFVFDAGSYAFAVRHGFKLAEPINEALFNISESGQLDQIKKRWLGGLPYRRHFYKIRHG